MKKLFAIFTAAGFALALTVHAEKTDSNAVKKGPKPRAVVQKQQFAPKQQRIAPNPHISTARTQHLNKPVHTNTSVINKKQPRHEMVYTPEKTAPSLQSKKIQKQSQLQTNAQSNELPAVQKNSKTTIAPNNRPIPNIQNIQARYKNFKAKQNPAIASARFNQNYRIAGAQNWSGPQYQVFSSYRPQWHDRGWWDSRYSTNILLIGGGWYYWDAGYWYPAWGYDESAAYYPYDGPIYVGDNRTPFDQVVADVQASLQEQGYYQGEVDGLMGPQTRQALADFQRDHGLITTAALDQPTLASLGLG
jgi:hypothetical protein